MFKNNNTLKYSDIKIQVLENNNPAFKETIVFYTRNGKYEQEIFYIERVKGASDKYYIEQTKKRFDQLFKSIKVTKKRMLKPLIIAGSIICAVGLCVGITFAVKNSQTIGMVNVTFDSGVGQFQDSSRIKTIKVARGTKLCDIPHDFASIRYGTKGFDEYSEDLFYSTRLWITDLGQTIDENLGLSDYVITNDITLFADYSGDLISAKKIAIGAIGSQAAESLARQPEYYNEIIYLMNTGFNWLDTANDGYKAFAIGQMTSHAIEGSARMPDSAGDIRKVLMNGCLKLYNMPSNDARDIGIGMIYASAANAIAIVPDYASTIINYADLICEKTKKAATATNGYAMSYATQAAFETFSSSPDIFREEALKVAILDAFDYINISDDTYESFAIGKTAAGVVEAAGRQPEALNDTIKFAHLSYAAFHSLPNDGRVEGLGQTGYDTAIAIGRQPEAQSDITSIAEITYNAARDVIYPSQGKALGNAGGAAAAAAARQPEAIKDIKSILLYTIYEILHS